MHEVCGTSTKALELVCSICNVYSVLRQKLCSSGTYLFTLCAAAHEETFLCVRVPACSHVVNVSIVYELPLTV